MTLKRFVFYLMIAVVSFSCTTHKEVSKHESPVDFVNPYMGNISHLLVPTFPTVHLPNSMLRVIPARADFTTTKLNGLPVVLTSHRGYSAFKISPFSGTTIPTKHALDFSYDQEKITPYSYSVYLDEAQVEVDYAPSHQSAIYRFQFEKDDVANIFVSTANGEITVADNVIRGYQNLENDTKVYVYIESDKSPAESRQLDKSRSMMTFSKGVGEVKLRYGISFISVEQARKNLAREISDFDLSTLAQKGRDIWNTALGKLEANGDPTDLAVFYTSLYRCYERPVCISEDGKYYSAFDHAVHEDEGVPFYTDDWIWDTYRAVHPLRCLIDTVTENYVINSFLRMTDQMDNKWMPTFPSVTGDARAMNSNHGVATILDGYRKGITGFDLPKAYKYAVDAIEKKTLAPWSSVPAGKLNEFYDKHGYIPALPLGEKETYPEVHSFENRQPVAVTLGTAYDQWCLGQIAQELGRDEEAEHYNKKSFNYRNLYNEKTQFFHPKDEQGNFIEPFDYSWSGGMGAREYYDENNGWVYRWDVPHHIEDLVSLMGGKEQFDRNLDQTFDEPLGRSKYAFYAKLPDHTGNVGQFSMANEPSLHIPYLYNYAGKPWKTQKVIHKLIHEWFRNDLMGVPGDEDGGGMSAFVVFSMMGFYPITPGAPVYTIGSPFMEEVTIHLNNNKTFTVRAKDYSKTNKYIQSASINGKELNTPTIQHSDIVKGGELVFVMGPKANRAWGTE